MAMFEVEVFWVVTPYSVVVEFRRFRRLHPEKVGSLGFWNIAIPPQHYTASQPIRPGLEIIIIIIIISSSSSGCSSSSSSKSRDSSVGVALGYGLDDRGSRFRFPAGAGNFSLHHCVENGFGAHSASYPMGTKGSFPGGKAAGAWSWLLTSI
jgi:hypothetical protein